MSRTHALALSAILLLHAALAYWGFGGYQSIDDYCYSKLAYAFSHPEVFTGDILYRELYLNRLTVWLPPALLLKIFPLNDFTLSLWPFLCSMLTVALVFWLGSRVDLRTGIFGAVLLAVNLNQLQYATTLVPDVIVSLFILLAGCTLFSGRRAQCLAAQISLGAALALVFSLAIFAKETASWIAPFILLLFARDCLRRKNFAFWIAAAIAQSGCAALICGMYQYFTGDPLYRLKVVDHSLNVSVFSFAGSGVRAYFGRLTWEPLLLFLRDKGYAIVFTLSLFAAANALARAQWLHCRLRFWAGLYFTLLLTFWFGSTSLRYYNPILPDPRHLLCLLPAMCLLSGALLAQVFRQLKPDGELPSRPVQIAALLLLIPAIAVLAQGAKIQALTYIVLAGLIGLQLVRSPQLPLKKYLRGMLPGSALLLLIALMPVYFIALKGWFRYPDHRTEKRIVDDYLKSVRTQTVVLTDFATAGYIQYHFRYNLPRPLKIQRWDKVADAGELTRANAQVYILINRNRARHVAEVHRIPTPQYIPASIEQRKPLLDENDVEFYRLK